MTLQNTNLISKEKTTKENRIWVRISSACNNKCIFCLDENAQDGTLVSEEIVKWKIRNWFKEWEYNRIIISGWEASINPKFPEYIRYAKEIWYDKVQTVTNGNMFSIPNFCNKVFTAWLDEVTFSFHGHTSSLHNYLVDTPWAFHKSLTWLIYIKKYFPDIIINIDIVVNKVNVSFLPDIVKFFMKLGVYEYDILHIIPFWRGFDSYENILFYDVEDYLEPLHQTWELSKIPWMYMWTNRFPVQAFEWYEELIQDPRKIKSEVMWEWYKMYSDFIRTKWKKKPNCFWKACKHCFINQYCHDYLNHTDKKIDKEDVCIIDGKTRDYSGSSSRYIALQSELFVSEIYEKYWETPEKFIEYIQNIKIIWSQEFLNIPKCIIEKSNNWSYQFYPDIREADPNIEEYTSEYILNFYRKKGNRCRTCKFYDTCEWINLNFIRAYWFWILKPIK